MKKSIALLLFLTLLTASSAFAALAAETPAVSYYAYWCGALEPDSYVERHVQDMTGMDIQVRKVAHTDKEAVNLMLASGDMPDCGWFEHTVTQMTDEELIRGIPVEMVRDVYKRQTYNLMAGVLRSLGDGNTPLYAMIVASVINIALDLLFVAVFSWGVAGAAVATLIGQISSCLFCFLRLRGVEAIRLSRADFAPDRARLLHLLRLGTPLAVQNAIISIGGMIVQSVVNGLGVLFIAGYTATNKLYGMLEVAATSFGYATTTYVAQNLGARRIDRIRSGLRASVVMCIAASASIGALMLLLGRPILSLFITGSPQEVETSLSIAYEFLSIMSVSLPILYMLYVYRSALQGLGDTLTPMLSGFVEFLMRTGSAVLLPGLIGYQGVFWAEVLAWLGAAVLLVISYYRRFLRLCPGASPDA